MPCYADSGIGRVADFDFTVPNGQTAVIGGVTIKEPVSGKTYDKGLLLAFPAGTKVRLTVVDGFYRLTPESKTNTYFCDKIQEYVANSWLLRAVAPLAGWSDCWTVNGIQGVDTSTLLADMSQLRPAAPAAPAQPTATPAPEKPRVTSGKAWIDFQAGDRVVGYWVEAQGKGRQQLCYYDEAPAPGRVFDGVVNGWDGETHKYPACK
jgi:hypothetical protein